MSDAVIRGMLELDVEYKKVAEGLAVVNAQFGKTESIANDVSAELTKLAAREEQLLKAREKANNPTVMVKYNDEIKKVRTEIDKLTKSQDNLNSEQKKLTESSSKIEQSLKKAFNVTAINAAKESTTKLHNEVKELLKTDPKKTPVENISHDSHEGVKSLKELKAEYQATFDEAIKLGVHTPFGKEKLKQAGELLREIKEIKKESANLGTELKTLTGTMSTIGTGVAGFEAVLSVQGLFGEKNEELEETLKKVILAQSLLNSVREIAEALEAKSATRIFLTNTLLKAQAAGLYVVSAATAVFNAILNANPIVLIITGVAALVTGLGYLGGFLGKIGDAFVLMGKIAFNVLNVMSFGILGLIANSGSLIDVINKQYLATLKQIEADKKRVEQVRKTIEALQAQATAEAELMRRKNILYEQEKRLLEARNKDTKKSDLENLKQQEESLRKQIAIKTKEAETAKTIAGKRFENADVQSITDKLLSIIDSNKIKNPEGLAEFERVINKLDKLNADLGVGTKNRRGLKESTAGLSEDLKSLRKILNDEEVKDAEIFTDLADKIKEKADKIKDIISGLRDELEKIQDENAQLKIDTFFSDDDKINKTVDLQKKIFNRELDQRRAALKSEGLLTQEADSLLAQIRIENNNKFEAERTQQLVNAANERAKTLIETENELSQMEIELRELGLSTEEQNFDARIELAQDYYSKRIAIAKKLGESENDIRKIELQRDIDVKKLQKAQIDDLISKHAAMFDEKNRHELAMAQLAKASEAEQLQIQIEAETLKLANLIMSGQSETLETEKTNNKIKELEAQKTAVEKQASKDKTQRILDDIGKIVQATIDATQQIIAAKLKEVDNLISLQQKRIDDTIKIADRGNAELLEMEQKRLDDLNKQKEKFVRAQQALAVIELVANSAVAIAKAAAEGGAAAPITIAETLIALIGGFVAAREAAKSAAFYEGGYTGGGNPTDEAGIVHKKEWVFDHEKTGQFYDIFNRVHMGDIDLNEWERKVDAYDAFGFDSMHLMRPVFMPVADNSADINELKGVMFEILYELKGQQPVDVNVDQHGFSVGWHKFQRVQSKINKLAR